jgi:hypothetical protein
MNIKHVMSLLAVIHCDIMTASQEKELMLQVEGSIINNTTVKKDDFMNLKFWFENTGHPTGDLGISLKHVLYEINKDDNVKQFLIFRKL